MRSKNCFTNTPIAKDGCFSCHIDKETTERLRNWCRDTNTNMTRFVEIAVNDALDIREAELYKMMSNEELIKEIIKYKQFLRIKDMGDRA